MDLIDVMKQRRSIRGYCDTPVEQEKLDLILEAARVAPTAKNAQMWKIIVVRDRETIRKLVPACRDQKFVGEAPVFLAVCANSKRIMRCGQSADTVDCSIVMSHVVLEAASLGLGTCWLGAFLQNEVKDILGVPEDYEVVAVTPLGYSDHSPSGNTNRKDLSELVVYEKWNKTGENTNE